MTALPLITIGGDGQSSDLLQLLATLLGAPSVDPMFRQQVIRVPLGHTVFRWDCLVADCERPRAGRGDLCSAHLRQWRTLDQQGQVAKARFVAHAQPLPLAEWPEERVCRLCPHRSARNLACGCAAATGCAGIGTDRRHRPSSPTTRTCRPGWPANSATPGTAAAR